MLLLWGVLSVTVFWAWVRGADHRDFYPRWAGARLALFDEQDLYSPETTLLIQLELYGAPLQSDADQQGFAYPAQLVVLLFPFWFIDDVEVAAAAWAGLSIVIILSTLYLARCIWGKPPIWVLVGGLFWHYSLLMVFQTQITAIPLAAVGVGYWAYSRQRDVAAGVALAAGIIKPELVLGPTVVLLILAVRARRWPFVLAFGIAQVMLFVGSIIIAGWWVPGWIQALTRYTAYAQTALAWRTAWTSSPLVAVALLALIWGLIKHTRWSEPAAVAASVPIGMLLLPQTPVWGLTILVLPLTMAWKGRARWAIVGAWSIGWLLILGSLRSDWWQLQNLLMPALTLVAVSYASRQQR
jgi:hypothetical protein